MLSLRRRRHVLAGASLLAFVSSLGGCSKPLTTTECNDLLDRYVEKLVGADRPGTSAAELGDLKREARRRAAEDPAFRECAERVSRRSFDCAMDAISADVMEQCLL
jgi:hypothetical protein